ncbi:C-C motif chemokine 4 [Buceros rhinoceros silvestris]|uniref:C-C motif chemokine n=1 Tax=Buceros rhinoceros silvestris TaxID=175836 RepID=A0A091H0F9_BUCRH|nr:PREDICTED: C-C motif chemokine 4-like [Buceros rhinoceros silvestris]KFO89321.1 C-C motif chemokine 4 [Buceros rhinoceros silvestris]
MKVPAAVFALLLIAASCSQTFSGPVGSDLPICCFTYTQQKLPRKLILRYYSTSTSCTLPAVVFITKKGRQVCANPNDTWVQSYLQNLKQN